MSDPTADTTDWPWTDADVDRYALVIAAAGGDDKWITGERKATDVNAQLLMDDYRGDAQAVLEALHADGRLNWGGRPSAKDTRSRPGNGPESPAAASMPTSDSPAPGNAVRDVQRLIDASSLGTPDAVRARASVDDDTARRIVERTKQISATQPQ